MGNKTTKVADTKINELTQSELAADSTLDPEALKVLKHIRREWRCRRNFKASRPLRKLDVLEMYLDNEIDLITVSLAYKLDTVLSLGLHPKLAT